MIRLFVGLGNPGDKYERTRHNAGFWWVDALAAQWRAELRFEKAYNALLASVSRPQGKVWLMQPQTFMNLSGDSVSALARFHKIAPDEVLVAYDELDLVPGQMKLKQGGRATHNGLRDLNAKLGEAYWRLKLGIGHPGVKSEVIHWVLKTPSPEHREAIDGCITKSLPAVEAMLSGDMLKAVATVHAGPVREKPPRAPTAPAPAGALSEASGNR
jgi:PTH1 family peptidyl-tRNA hydrolase